MPALASPARSAGQALDRSRDWRELLAAARIAHKRTRPYRPQTNGKVERFNRTLLEELANEGVRARCGPLHGAREWVALRVLVERPDRGTDRLSHRSCA